MFNQRASENCANILKLELLCPSLSFPRLDQGYVSTSKNSKVRAVFHQAIHSLQQQPF